MPLAAYCKKCKIEVPVAECCDQCGGKLTKNAVRYSFRFHHVRWRDWNCWNSLLRVGGPVWLLICAVVAVSEIAAAGWEALGALLTSATAITLAGVAVAAVLLTGLWLAAAGSEMQYFFLDAKGVTLSTYLEKPSRLRLWLRGQSASRMAQLQPEDAYGLYLGERHLPWTAVKRVQVWHDKNRILLYSPGWWMQMAVNCPASEYDEAVDYVLSKLSKRKDVKIQHTPESYGLKTDA